MATTYTRWIDKFSDVVHDTTHSGGIRTRRSDRRNIPVESIRKTRMGIANLTIDTTDIHFPRFVRVVHSCEIPVVPHSCDKTTTVTWERRKCRHVFISERYTIEVSMIQEGETLQRLEEAKTRYELEIELINAGHHCNAFVITDLLLKLCGFCDGYYEVIPTNIPDDADASE
jgi:hypothetical protein